MTPSDVKDSKLTGDTSTRTLDKNLRRTVLKRLRERGLKNETRNIKYHPRFDVFQKLPAPCSLRTHTYQWKVINSGGVWGGGWERTVAQNEQSRNVGVHTPSLVAAANLVALNANVDQP